MTAWIRGLSGRHPSHPSRGNRGEDGAPGDGGAVETKIGHRLDQFFCESALAVAFLEIFFDEFARGVAHEALVFVEQGIEVNEIDALVFESHRIFSGAKWQTLQRSREEGVT